MGAPLIREIPYRDPLIAFAPFAGEEGAVLLDSAAEAGGRGRWSFLCARPSQVWLDPADPFAALSEAKTALPEIGPTALGGLPFVGGLVGWLCYEVGRHAERMPEAKPDDIGLPEAAFGRYDAVMVFDDIAHRTWLCALPGCEDRAEALLEAAGTAPLPSLPTVSVGARPMQTRAEATASIEAAIAAIRAGDIFQANITQRWLADLPPDLPPFALYRRLRAVNPAPFSACLSFGGAHLLSASPERFLSVSGRRVEARPIKGTRPRGRTPDHDAALAKSLLLSAKDRAENLMIVDLLRNDLSRVCTVGSIGVPILCGLETFATVHHLVSVVTGDLREDCDAVDLLRAAFPGGSITGAPKVRAMEIIRDLEPARRGAYCGSVFRLGAEGGFDSSIIIRSLAVGRSGRVAAQAGGGITADSDPEAEVEEAVVKVRALLRALSGD